MAASRAEPRRRSRNSARPSSTSGPASITRYSEGFEPDKAPSQVLDRASGPQLRPINERAQQAFKSVAVGQGLASGQAGRARQRPQLGRRASPDDPPQSKRRTRVSHGRHAADIMPTHLEIAGPTLVVRGVEDEVDALVPQLVDSVEGQPGEDASTLEVGMGGRVDRPHGSHHSIAAPELPSHEHAQPDEGTVGDGGARGDRPKQPFTCFQR